MSTISGIGKQDCVRFANGLQGALDRWNGGQILWDDARTIQQQIIHASPQIAAVVESELTKMATTIQNATHQQWIVILPSIVDSLAKRGKSSASFGLQEWGIYLSAKIRTYDVIFIGGGPIGLWTAILTKVQSVALSILVVEKRTSYVRGHSLDIDRSAFDEYSVGLSADVDAIVEDFKRRRVIPIKEVEEILVNSAQSIGVQIEYVTLVDPYEISQKFPDTHLFIGSDGARSIVRKNIFEDERRLDATIQRIVQIQYDIKQTSTATFHIEKGIIDGSYKTIASMNTTLIDERAKPTQNETKKTLTFAVQEEVFGRMTGATFQHPFTLASPGLPLKMQQDFFLWCGMKEEVYGEVRIPDSEAITGIDGKAYISNYFVKRDENGQIWFLVGDAAASFPLQRGFNVGLKCGIRLAQSITEFFSTPNHNEVTGDGIDGSVPAPFAAYAEFGLTIEDQELCFLNCPLDKKRRGIGLWRFVTALGSALPGITKLDSVTHQRYLQIGQTPGQTLMGQIGKTQDLVAQSLAKFAASKAAAAGQAPHG